MLVIMLGLTAVFIVICATLYAFSWYSVTAAGAGAPVTLTVIDDDLGLSAGALSVRPGFQELLTRVALKEIGIILFNFSDSRSRSIGEIALPN
jgi:hypothetical protein